MTCYSAKYIGDKIKTYHEYEEYLLMKLVHKIEHKYNLTPLGDLAPLFRRGYITSNGHINKSVFYNEWRYTHELYEDEDLMKVIDYIDCPIVYFDLRYDPNNFNSYEYVSPDMVLDTFKDAAMIEEEDLIVIENLRHSSNAKYFRILLPMKYYTYRDELTYENKKINKQLTPYLPEYKLILDFLISHYQDYFNRIYMVPDYEENCMEYYLRYTGDWRFDYRNHVNREILYALDKYCEENNLMNIFIEHTSIFITRELDEKKLMGE